MATPRLAERGAAGEGQGAADATTLDEHAIWSDADSTPLAWPRRPSGLLPGRACGGATAISRLSCEAWWTPCSDPPRFPGARFCASSWPPPAVPAGQAPGCGEHRRFSHDTPGIRKRRRLNLLVGIDVSDSTNIVELREAFARELLQIARGRESRITVLYANSRIQRIEAFSGSSCGMQRYDGGGFTDLRPVFEYARTMQPLPAAVIYLTDGIGPAPEQMDFPTLWVLTGEGEKPVPWGVEMRLEV